MKKHLIITLICVLALMLIATGCSKKTDTYEPSSVESSAADEGTLSMANIFADGMVLQRQEPINVYGFATEGESVTVTLGESTATAVSENGEWSVKLPAMEAAKGLTLTVTAGDESLVFEDVDVGEVFVVSGQSNAQYFAYQLEDWEEIAPLVDTYDNIRVFAEPSYWDMLPSDYGYGTWIKGTRENLEPNGPVKGYVSAVGYVMAMKIAAELGPDVTVALINVTRSGTQITAWLPAEELYKDPEIHADDIARYEDYLAFWNKHGRWPQSTEESKYWKSGNPYSYIPTLCYNSMIAPIKGYTARAVLWYQGESDSDSTRAAVYGKKFAALKELYSERFANDDIPFFVVQIAPYNSDLGTLAAFEAIQYDLSLDNPNTYIIPTGVDGTPLHMMDMLYGAPPEVIHPSRKSPLGYRAADMLLTKLFDVTDKITTAPELTSVVRGEGTVTLTFDTALCLLRGVEAEDFEVYDSASSKWVKVGATLVGNTVVLDTAGITSPSEVRYGFGGRYIELYTGELIRLNAGSRFQLKVDADGVKYAEYTDTDVSPTRVFTFYSEDGQVIRTIKSGNVTNASGVPLPTFTVAIP
ncbi:MAG: hypothetical protein IKL79_01670 [Clostridia bacterium]|nr:hypothetical protein [Clostridia bacterium]